MNNGSVSTGFAAMDQAVAKRVIELIAEQALIDVDQVKLDSTPEELGIDSLALVESIFSIEESFDIQVPFNANEQHGSDFDISTVGTIIEAVADLVAQKGD